MGGSKLNGIMEVRQMPILNSKIFAEIPDEINQDWHHGALVGGMVELYWENIKIANAYKLAGDLLIEQMLDNQDDIDEAVFPALFNYRHAIEIYLKACLLVKCKGHNIKNLVERLIAELKTSGLFSGIPCEITSVCLEFYEYDAKSTAFRYDDDPIKSNVTGDLGEFWVDFILLKKKMDLVKQYFSELEERKGFINP